MLDGRIVADTGRASMRTAPAPSVAAAVLARVGRRPAGADAGTPARPSNAPEHPRARERDAAERTPRHAVRVSARGDAREHERLPGHDAARRDRRHVRRALERGQRDVRLQRLERGARRHERAGRGDGTAFTANSLAGRLPRHGASDYGSVIFSLVNTATGVSAAIVAAGGAGQSAGVGAATPRRSRRVIDRRPARRSAARPSRSRSVRGRLRRARAGAASSAARTGDRGHRRERLGAPRPAHRERRRRPFTASASTEGVVEPAIFALDNTRRQGADARGSAAPAPAATVGARYPHPLEAPCRTPRAGPSRARPSPSRSARTGGGAAGAACRRDDHARRHRCPRRRRLAALHRGLDSRPLHGDGLGRGRHAAGHLQRSTTSPRRSPSIAAFEDPPATARIEAALRPPAAGADPRRRRPAGRGRRGHVRARRRRGARGAGAAAGATFAGGSAQATAVTNANGVAVSPPLTANGVAGSYAATASSTAAPGAVTLRPAQRGGSAGTVTPGAASGETADGRLALPRPARGGRHRREGQRRSRCRRHLHRARARGERALRRHGRTVRVRTDADGDRGRSGVRRERRRRRLRRARERSAARAPAAFALVNLPRGWTRVSSRPRGCGRPTSSASRPSACARAGCAPRCRRSGSRSASRRSSPCSACRPRRRPGCSPRSTGSARTC